MSDKEFKEISNRIREGLALAEKRMLEEKAQHNEKIVISNHGCILEVDAKDALRQLESAAN